MTADSRRQMSPTFSMAHAPQVSWKTATIGFDLMESKDSISGEYNKCLLHL
jgi:hypothetical protein